MNRYLVVVQDSKGYPAEPSTVEEAPRPRDPEIHSSILVSDIETYLDGVIWFWRKQKSDASDGDEYHTAECYVDAYQLVRLSILGKMLP